MRCLLTLLVLTIAACQTAPEATDADVLPDDGPPVVTMASTAQMDRIRAALPEGVTITRTYAVRSETHDFAHYIAAKLRSGPAQDSIAIWFMQDGMDVPGEAYAVNALARRLTAFPPMGEVDPQVLDTHREIAALRQLTATRR